MANNDGFVFANEVLSNDGNGVLMKYDVAAKCGNQQRRAHADGQDQTQAGRRAGRRADGGRAGRRWAWRDIIRWHARKRAGVNTLARDVT